MLCFHSHYFRVANCPFVNRRLSFNLFLLYHVFLELLLDLYTRSESIVLSGKIRGHDWKEGIRCRWGWHCHPRWPRGEEAHHRWDGCPRPPWEITGLPHVRESSNPSEVPMSASQRGEDDMEGQDRTKWLIVIHENFGARSGMSFLRFRIQNKSEGEDKI